MPESPPATSAFILPNLHSDLIYQSSDRLIIKNHPESPIGAESLGSTTREANSCRKSGKGIFDPMILGTPANFLAHWFGARKYRRRKPKTLERPAPRLAIRSLPIGADGLSKKIYKSFLELLRLHRRFEADLYSQRFVSPSGLLGVAL